MQLRNTGMFGWRTWGCLGVLTLVACGGGGSGNGTPDSGLPDTGQDSALPDVQPPEDVAILSAAPTDPVLAGEDWQYEARASGPGTITWTLNNAPSGMTFKDGVNTGTDVVLEWATEVDEDGAYADIELTADNEDTSDTQTFTVVVNPRPAVPQIDVATNPPPVTTVVDVAYSYDVDLIAEQSALEVTWSLDDSPDSNMFINASTGEVTWTPDTVGTFEYTVRATNSIGEFDTETVEVAVQAAPAAPQFTTTPPVTGDLVLGISSYSYAPGAVGNPPPSITVSGSLPPGFTFSNGVLSNSPGDMVVGAYSFDLVATNAHGSANQAINVTVINPPPTVLSITPAAGRRQSDVPITVRGVGFDCGKNPEIAIQLGNGTPESFATTCVDSTRLTATVSVNTSRGAGVYGVVVSQANSADALLPKRFTVTSADDSGLNTVPGGTLSGVTTWTAAGSPWRVTGSVTVTGQLTIEPGAVVMFNTDSTLYFNTGFSGTTGSIMADGGAPGSGDQIVFTRYQAAGGAAPSGHYRGLRFGATTDLNLTRFRNTVLEFAGGGDNQGALYIEGANNAPLFTDSIIRETEHEAVYLNTGVGVTSSAWFDHNWITRSGEYPMHVHASDVTTLGPSLTFTENGLTEANSNYIRLHGTNVSREGSSLRNYADVDAGFGAVSDNIPYRAAGLTVNGFDLTIAPGVVVEFDQNTQLRVGNGTTAGQLVADGTPSQPIVLRTYAGAAGDWQRLYFDTNATAGSILSDVRIEDFYEGGIHFQNSDPVVTVQGVAIQSDIANSDGIYVASGSPGPSSFTTSTIDVARYAVEVRQGALTSVLGVSNTYRDVTNGASAASIMRVLGGGVLTGAATWARARASDNSTMPLVLTGDINVGANATLTIAAGSVLHMPDNAQIDVNAGVLNVAGVSGQPVTFQSADPGTVYWSFIDFSNPGPQASTLTHTIIQNAGSEPGQAANASRASVLVRAGSIVNISNTSITGSSGYGISVQDGSHTDNVFTNNIVTGSEFAPLRVHADYVGRMGLDLSSTLSGNTTATLGHDGIYVVGDDINTTATWPFISVPYYVHGSIEVRGLDTVTNAALTITPGVSVRFMPNTYMRVGLDRPGALIANGALGTPIEFTAADTTQGWQGLFFRGGTESSSFFFGTTTILDYFTISYGGTASAIHGNINFEETSEVAVRDVTTTHSRYFGMSRLSTGATPNFAIGSRDYLDNGQISGGNTAYDCVRQTSGACVAE